MDFALATNPDRSCEFEDLTPGAHRLAEFGQRNRLLLAALRIGRDASLRPVVARILSPDRLTTKGYASVVVGSSVRVLLRNVGWVEGTIARVHADNCEVAVSRWPEHTLGDDELTAAGDGNFQL